MLLVLTICASSAACSRGRKARGEVDAAPAYVEGALPLVPAVRDHAATAADPGIVEQQMDTVGRVLVCGFVAKAHHVSFAGHVGEMRGDAQALRKPRSLALSSRLRHAVLRDIAHGDVTALGHQQAYQLAPHSRAATGDDSNPAGEFFHRISSRSAALTRP